MKLYEITGKSNKIMLKGKLHIEHRCEEQSSWRLEGNYFKKKKI